MEAEKRKGLSETSQHQFRIISITNQSSEKLSDNHPSYLHQHTCDVARHFCACQHYKLQVWPWLSSPSTEKLLLCLAPPLSSLHKKSTLPQYQSGIIYCCWSLDRNHWPPLFSPKRDKQMLSKWVGFTQVVYQPCQISHWVGCCPPKRRSSALLLCFKDLLKISLSVLV